MIIPGSKKLKDIDHFLQPLVEELLELDSGVETVDGDSKSRFSLHAWVTFVTGMFNL